MSFVITVAQQKGGAGKTMLAANLAAALASTRRVAMLDIDPQRSLTRWHALRQAQTRHLSAITASDLSGWRLRAELNRLRQSHDVVIVDSAPHLDIDARLAVREADLVLVPLQPSPPDFWAAEGTLTLAQQEKRLTRLVLNRAPAASRLRSGVEKAIAAAGHRLMTSTLGNRAGFANAFAAGMGVTEASPKSQAAQEIVALLTEIEALLTR
jgi:chromosome partitioning protein